MEPMIPKPFIDISDGSYLKWFPTDFPLLAQNNVAAGKLILRPRGFAVPHYSDCSKVGFVLEGNGVAGLVFPNKSDEAVVNLTKGDLIPIPEGVTSWWFNNGDSDFQIIFLGETEHAHIPGNISYFILTGPLGVLQGFPPENVARTYNLTGEQAKDILSKQTNGLIFMLEEGKTLPRPHKHSKLVYNIVNAVPDIRVTDGGSVTTVTESRFPFIGQSGLTAVFEKLDANTVRSPVYGADPSVQLIYIVEGSGRIQIIGYVGFAGNIDVEVTAGQLILIPRYFVVGKVAGAAGLECFSIFNTTSPLVEELGGRTSVFEALSPEVLQHSFNLTADFEKLFRSNITKTPPLVAPDN